MKIFKLSIVLSLLLTLLSFQNCSMVATPEVDEMKLTSQGNSEAAALQANAMKVINNRCGSCHSPALPSGGIDYIKDVDSLLYYGLVIPGEPQISPLFQVIQSGDMPPAAHLSSSESQAIYNWITSGFSSGGGVTPPPPPPVTLTPTFASINNLILRPKCLGCHNANNMAGGVSYATYQATMNSVQAGNPAASSLFATVNSGIMPKGGTRLTAGEINAIQTWIMNNAPNN